MRAGRVQIQIQPWMGSKRMWVFSILFVSQRICRRSFTFHRIDHRMTCTATIKTRNFGHSAKINLEFWHPILSNSFTSVEPINNWQLHQLQLQFPQRSIKFRLGSCGSIPIFGLRIDFLDSRVDQTHLGFGRLLLGNYLISFCRQSVDLTLGDVRFVRELYELGFFDLHFRFNRTELCLERLELGNVITNSKIIIRSGDITLRTTQLKCSHVVVELFFGRFGGLPQSCQLLIVRL